MKRADVLNIIRLSYGFYPKRLSTNFFYMSSKKFASFIIIFSELIEKNADIGLGALR